MGALIAGYEAPHKPSLRFETTHFATLGELDKILQLGSSCWHTTFGKL